MTIKDIKLNLLHPGMLKNGNPYCLPFMLDSISGGTYKALIEVN